MHLLVQLRALKVDAHPWPLHRLSLYCIYGVLYYSSVWLFIDPFAAGAHPSSSSTHLIILSSKFSSFMVCVMVTNYTLSLVLVTLVSKCHPQLYHNNHFLQQLIPHLFSRGTFGAFLYWDVRGLVPHDSLRRFGAFERSLGMGLNVGSMDKNST